MRSSLLRMRSSLMVKASDCQCTSCNGPGFDPSIRRHSGIWGAADEAVLNIVRRKTKNIPQKNIKKKIYILCNQVGTTKTGVCRVVCLLAVCGTGYLIAVSASGSTVYINIYISGNWFRLPDYRAWGAGLPGQWTLVQPRAILQETG
jgi:hypothetical protein